MMPWSWLLGLDFGIRDATAYVVLGWRQYDRTVYVAESWKETGKSPSEVAETVQDLSKRYSFHRIVGDLGGMGKAFAAEMQRRYSIPILPADKTNKLGYIHLLNGAFARGEVLIVEPTNRQLIAELMALPWSDETQQKPAEGFEDHLCLVAGTMVETSVGMAAIEDVIPGMLVVTRAGLANVVSSGCTGIREVVRLETEAGRELVGTPDHPVWTQRGWVALELLTRFDTVLAWGSTVNAKWSSLKGADTGDIRIRRVESYACTLQVNAVSDFTERSGLRTTGPYRRDTSCITETGTLSTTTSQTSSSSRAQSTCLIMPANRSGLPSQESASKRPLPKHPSGIDLKLGGHGTQTMGRSLGSAAPTTTSRAPSAPSRSDRYSRMRSSAETRAMLPSAVGLGSTMSVARAPFALSPFGPTNTESNGFALDRVTRVTPTGCVAPVYSLTVSGPREFIANGIVVHNCDALAYGWKTALAFLEPAAPQPIPEANKWQQLAREQAFRPRDEDW